MWALASRSDSRAGRFIFLAAVVLLSLPGRATAATAEETLARLFPPPATVRKDTLFLTDAQMEQASAVAGLPLPSKIVSRYVVAGGDGGAIEAFAYLDTHLVRTAPETLLIVVDAAGRVSRIEVLAFEEPREYLPPARWFAQFDGRPLDPDLQLKRSIRTLSGATLSSRAATEAVRRALAVHRVVQSGREAP